MENKWAFLESFVRESKERNKEISVTEIGELAIKAFGLELDREQARRVVSRILNERKEDLTLIEEWKKDLSWVESKEVEVKPQEWKFTKIEADLKPKDPRIRWNKEGQYLVLGCWHVPFHNEKMTDGVLRLMEDINLEGVVFNGDFLDCNSLSSHDRGRFTAIPGLNLKQEYQEGYKLLSEFNKQIPKEASKAYMYGNHEDRYWRYVSEMQNAKTPPQSPAEGLKLTELGFTALESYSDNFLTLGDHLDVIHGIFFSDHCAKKHIDRFRGSCLFAHTHRIQTYIEGNVGGFNIGWGGDKNSPAFRYADRAMKASWQNGFAIVNIDRNKDYYVQQVICNNGGFYYNGKKY